MHIGFFGKVSEDQIQEFKTLWPDYSIKHTEIQDNLEDFRALREHFQRPEKINKELHTQIPLETLVCWIWENFQGDLPEDVVTDGKFAWREMVSYFDVIFFFPQEETTNFDAIRKAMVKEYDEQKDSFFPREDCPAVIPIAGPEDLRISQLQLYLTTDGTPYGEQESLVDFNELTMIQDGKEN